EPLLRLSVSPREPRCLVAPRRRVRPRRARPRDGVRRVRGALRAGHDRGGAVHAHRRPAAGRAGGARQRHRHAPLPGGPQPRRLGAPPARGAADPRHAAAAHPVHDHRGDGRREHRGGGGARGKDRDLARRHTRHGAPGASPLARLARAGDPPRAPHGTWRDGPLLPLPDRPGLRGGGGGAAPGRHGGPSLHRRRDARDGGPRRPDPALGRHAQHRQDHGRARCLGGRARARRRVRGARPRRAGARHPVAARLRDAARGRGHGVGGVRPALAARAHGGGRGAGAVGPGVADGRQHPHPPAHGPRAGDGRRSRAAGRLLPLHPPHPGGLDADPQPPHRRLRPRLRRGAGFRAHPHIYLPPLRHRGAARRALGARRGSRRRDAGLMGADGTGHPVPGAL
ncbi:MAG: hypothetical protein AVDCRST_MAG68-3687, partial [uncultured Gemmatimonadetes bacterium]